MVKCVITMGVMGNKKIEKDDGTIWNVKNGAKS